MTPVRYLAGIATLSAIFVSLASGAVSVRRRWLTGWSGAPARLAEITVFIGILILLSEALGTIGQFRRGTLVVAAVAVGIGLVFVSRRSTAASLPHRPSTRYEAHPAWAMPAATLIAALVAVEWLGYVRDAYRTGIVNVDSLQYHLPFATRFAQTGDVSRLSFLWLDPTWSFYPSNGELVHAVGMVAFGRDIVSPLINVAWLSIALLAAWVLGRSFGIGHLSVGVTALIFASPLTAATQAGSGMNDATALALFLTCLALLAQADRRPAGTAVAGLAAGLAVGTKVTMIAPILAVTVALLVVTSRRRASTGWIWIGAVATGSGYWFVRNLVRTGSPIPAVSIPGLPSPRLPAVEAYGRSVAEYVGDGKFWSSVVPDGLREVFGATYPVILVLAGAGVLCALFDLFRESRGAENAEGMRGAVAFAVRPLSWMLLTAATVAGAVYVITPVTAYGPPGNPFLFGANLRYAFPAFLASLLLLTAATVNRRAVWGVGLTAVVLGVLAVELNTGLPGIPAPLSSRSRAFAVVVLLWALVWLFGRRGHEALRGSRFSIACGAAVLLVVVVGYPVARRYMEHRYTANPVWAWARTVHDARIAVVAYPAQYPLTGLDLSNRVDYLGRRAAGGSFVSYRRCGEFRRALHAGSYDYLVAGSEKWGLEPTPERQWEYDDRWATPIVVESHSGLTTVIFRVRASVAESTAKCT